MSSRSRAHIFAVPFTYSPPLRAWNRLFSWASLLSSLLMLPFLIVKLVSTTWILGRENNNTVEPISATTSRKRPFPISDHDRPPIHTGSILVCGHFL